MKLFIISGFAVLLCLYNGIAQEETMVTTTTPTALETVGTVTTFDSAGKVISITSSGTTSPVTYTYSDNLPVLDETGHTITMETIRAGTPVTVYYQQKGDRMVVSRVVVHKAPPLEEATQTVIPVETTGSITTLDPEGNVVTIKTKNSAVPVAYTYTKRTTIVDEEGNPVAVEVVKSGAPVTVYYAQKGDKLVASKMVVRKVPVSRETTTTTTTTTIVK